MNYSNTGVIHAHMLEIHKKNMIRKIATVDHEQNIEKISKKKNCW